MHHFKRILTAIFLTVLSVILLFSAAFAYLIVSPLGGKMLVRYFKEQFVAVGLMHVGHYQGTLQDGIILQDITIKGLTYIPDALLRIQEIHVHLPLWDLPHADFSIFNARISIPGSDPVIFTGDISGGQIRGDIYARSVDIHEASRFWATEDIRNRFQGYITSLDLKIEGPLSGPTISGPVTVDAIRYKAVTLSNVAARLNMELIPSSQQVQLNGLVTVDSGTVNVRKVNLQLQPSKLIFKGNIYTPTIDINMGSKVEDMDFHLSIKGPCDNPQLVVTSDPPMAPQEALQVLFTGNAWSSATSPFNGVTSSDLAENFLNYSLQDINDNTQGMGLKTKLTDRFKLGAEMDQLPAPPGETNVYYSRKVNGEMDFNDHMSLNVSREILQQENYPSYQDAEPQPDTQVYVQYKKRF